MPHSGLSAEPGRQDFAFRVDLDGGRLTIYGMQAVELQVTLIVARTLEWPVYLQVRGFTCRRLGPGRFFEHACKVVNPGEISHAVVGERLQTFVEPKVGRQIGRPIMTALSPPVSPWRTLNYQEARMATVNRTYCRSQMGPAV